ncbi:hypothetical protein ACGFRG_25815 [Streptomyces sp. NPDC048696]|uniref:hypothetical protein n=1 Tax=Streptomyces sp. NPDC048696 TaxID=3365585 RepID=UPI003719F0FB
MTAEAPNLREQLAEVAEWLSADISVDDLLSQYEAAVKKNPTPTFEETTPTPAPSAPAAKPAAGISKAYSVTVVPGVLSMAIKVNARNGQPGENWQASADVTPTVFGHALESSHHELSPTNSSITIESPRNRAAGADLTINVVGDKLAFGAKVETWYYDASGRRTKKINQQDLFYMR